MPEMISNLPLEIIELDDASFHILVHGSINGLSCNLIVDTGASRTVFDRNYFENSVEIFDVRSEDLRTAGIMADHIETLQAKASEFRLDGFSVKDMTILLIDLAGINDLYESVTGKSIHGLLGSDFFFRYHAVIDFGHSLLRLRQ
jgi:hypothetical protein